MLDVRPTAYLVPLDEQTIGPLTPIIHVENLADENAIVTGLVRIYRESLGTLIYTSVLHPAAIAHGLSSDMAAETEFNPGAPADDDYFILAEITARSTLTGNSETVQLGQFFFDIKPAPMGPVPATHHTTHENGGMDEISVAGLSGILGDIQPVDTHATSHQKAEPDAIEIANLGTSEMDDTLVLAPDGAGGVTFATPLPATRHEFEAFNLNDPWFDISDPAGNSHFYNIQAEPAHPGIIRAYGDPTFPAGIICMTNNSSFVLAGSETVELIFRALLLPNTMIRAGFFDPLNDPMNGCWIEIGKVGITPGTVRGVTSTTTNKSYTPTSYTISTHTWYRLRIELNSDATLVTFTLLNSTTGATLWTANLATNIPTAPDAVTGCGFSDLTDDVDITDDLIDVDFLSCTIKILAR